MVVTTRRVSNTMQQDGSFLLLRGPICPTIIMQSARQIEKGNRGVFRIINFFCGAGVGNARNYCAS